MSHGVALWKDSTATFDWGALSLAPDGRLALRARSGSAETKVDVPASPFVDVYATDDWVCAVGAADRQLILGHTRGPDLDVVAEISRLDRGGEYDSGAHAVRFRDRPGHDQCVLAWEIGVALVDPELGAVWTHVHHDVHQRLVRITAETVELMGADQAISLSLADGAARQRLYRKQPSNGAPP